MLLRRAASIILASLLGLGVVSVAPPTASADPLPASYAGSTDNEILGLDIGLFGFNLADVGLAHTETSIGSTASPRSFAEAANLAASVAGLSVPIAAVSESAPPDNGGPTSGGLTQVDVPGLLDTGALTGTADAHWTGDTSCPPSGTALASSSVQVAGVTLGNAVVEVAQLGAASTSGNTSLVSNGGTGDSRSVVSTSTGTIASLTLLNDAISVAVGGAPRITATASGSPGGASVTYVPPSVTVTALGTTRTLTPGAAVTISIPFVGSVTIRMGTPVISTTADGQNAAGEVSLLSIDVTLLGGLGTTSLDVLPLRAEAHAPAGGVQCALLDAPAITSPTDGSTTQDTTPTITGTGVPGATVTVTDGGTVVGTAVVAADGTWSLTPTSPMSLGSHTLSATQSTAAATSGVSNTPTFTIADTTAPDAPVITTPADGSTTNDATPVVSGTAEPGSTVEVVIDGVVIGTTTAAADGSWSVPVTTPLAEGEHTVTATATDAQGNQSTADNTTFTLDTAVAPPTITGPADGSFTTDSTPLIEGTAEPGATVTVVVDGTVIGTTTADPSGAWTLVPSTPLADGLHTVEATQTDLAGNTSAADSTTFTVDTTTPAAPVITGPGQADTIGDNTPTVTGTAEPGATVEVSIDGTVVGTTTADASGNWTLDTTAPLDDGPHQVSATQTDPAGNTSAADQNLFFVDTTSLAPVITGPASGTVTDDSTPQISGTGEAGATVTVTTSDGTALGTALVAPDGTWTLTPADPLPDGTYTISATQVDTLGNESAASSPVIFTVDTVTSTPVITSPADGSSTADSTPGVTGTAEPGATVTVVIDGVEVGTTTADPVTGLWSLDLAGPLADGPHTLTATATDPAGNTSPAAESTFTVDTTAPAAPVITGPEDGSVTSDTTPQVTGTAEPGATVIVIIDGVETGTAVADADGDWALPVTDPLADGPHTVTATATDEAGNTSPAAESTFTVDTAAPAPPLILTPADGATTGDSTPAITGTAEPGATVEVVVDGTVIGTTTADGSGAWTLTPTDSLADGPHTVAATQTDLAGNTSPPATSDFVVDTLDPAAPVITGPVDGSTTSDDTPVVRGTAEPGATVTVVVDGVVVGTAVAGPAGNWTLTLTDPLADGPHTVTATAIDAAGNTSPVSAPVDFTVDTTAPPAPVITAPADDERTNDTTPAITGTAEPGSTVAVLVDGVEIGTVVAAADGNWSITPPDPLTEGPHTITATATDAFGNTSPPASSDVIVDITDPAAPTITSPADGSTTGDSTPTIVGTAEPLATVEVAVDGVVIGTVTADALGQWFIDVPTALADGAHTATATQTDPAGNEGPAAASTFTVDTTVEAPEILLPANGTITDDPTPTIIGTGEIGATVTVSTSDGDVLGTAVVGLDGTWQLTPAALPDGTYTITATQVDLVGNASEESSAKIFTVDTAIAPPVVTAPVDGSLTADTTPLVTGTAEPAATVTVLIDGVVVGTTTADPLTGAWSLQLTDPLADGAHTASAVATDLAGNISATSAANDFTVDATPPPAPVITDPDDGAVLGASPPEITGTAEPGSTVTVVIDGVEVGTAVTDAGGSWTLSLADPLTDGVHTVTATATDEAGNTGPAASIDVVIDTTAAGAPVITGPADGSTVGDSTPTITGTAEPGATVEVVVDGVVIGTVTADPGSGMWTITVPTVLTDGAHTVEATQTDPAGNTSPAASSTFTVDTTAAAPTIDPAFDGLVTNDPTQEVSGTGEPGATVTVTTGTGLVVGTALVEADGTWTLVDPAALPDGVHTLTATQVDATGNTSPASSPVILTVDTHVAAPVIDPPTQPVTNDSTPTVTGNAEPGATVTVSVDGVVVGTTVADSTGAWTFTLPLLADGAYDVTATQTDVAGNASAASTPVTLTVDTVAPSAPTIDAPADGAVINNSQPTLSGTAEPGSAVTVTLDGTPTTVVAGTDGSWQLPLPAPLADGTHTVSVTATDAAGNVSAPTSSDFVVDTTAPAAPLITGPAPGATVGDDTPTITGTAEPGSTVVVTVDGTPYETTADPVTGAWTVDVTDPLADGTYTVSATATDPAGNISVPGISTFTVDTEAAAPVITSPTSGTPTNDTTPAVSGTGEPGATVTVTADGVVVGTALVTGDGTWTLVTAPLAEGPHTLVATQEDALGNTSPASSPVLLVIDTTVVAPVITSPAPGALTGDATPVITGTGEPGATVTVTVDGLPVGTTTVAGDGTWTLTPATALTDGTHQVAASQVDPAGNVSPPTALQALVVDTTAPAAPAITGPAAGAVTSDPTPLITGTGEPGATVRVVIDGVLLGTVVVAPDGTWSIPVTDRLGDALHTVDATQTDAAGNTSPATRSTFTVETPQPPPPTVDAPESGTDRTPTITGTGQPGATVQVIVDGAVAGTVQVPDSGSWAFTLDGPLSCGRHSVTATQSVPAALRASPPAAPDGFTITCPAAAGGNSDGIPATGAQVGAGVLALALMLVGSGLLLMRRRRR